jgi:Tfp pilus assembly protein PilN
MIKINLLAEKRQAKAKVAPRAGRDTLGTGQNLLLIAILAIGVGAAGMWWWTLDRKAEHWRGEIARAEQELKRLEGIRKKGEQLEAQKTLLAKKIDLITTLKKQQAVPVRILDQLSRNLPDFLWLESMSADKNQINIAGKATTYTAVSNFYSNLAGAGYFSDVTLGRTFEVPEGVSFSLSCRFTTVEAEETTAEVEAVKPAGATS